MFLTRRNTRIKARCSKGKQRRAMPRTGPMMSSHRTMIDIYNTPHRIHCTSLWSISLDTFITNHFLSLVRLSVQLTLESG